MGQQLPGPMALGIGCGRRASETLLGKSNINEN